MLSRQSDNGSRLPVKRNRSANRITVRKTPYMNDLDAQVLQTSQLKIHSTIEHLARCQNFVKEAVLPFSQFHNKLSAIEYVVNEGLNNALKHGNHFNPDKFITIRIKVYRDLLTVSIEDEGEGFNPNHVPNPLAPENREKCEGRGIFLMRHYAREISYEKGGRRLVLTFDIEPEKTL